MNRTFRKLLTVLIVVMTVRAQAQFDYVTNADGTGLTITGYSPSGPDAVIIPATIGALPVTSIGENAFEGLYDLTSVTIPYGVTNLGEEAFDSCFNMTNVTTPDSVISIGYGAFGASGLTIATIPGSVTNIAYAACASCASLTNITISYGVPYIVSNMFSGCANLARAVISGTVTNIEEYAFDGCSKLTQVYFMGNAPAVDGTVFRDSQTLFPGGYSNYYVTTAYYLPCTTGWAQFSSNTLIMVNPDTPVYIFVPAVLWNPTIVASGPNFGLQSNQFGFDIAGTTNIPIVIQACTNLAHPIWVPLQTLTLTNGLVHFSEPFQTNTPARFYRITAP